MKPPVTRVMALKRLVKAWRANGPRGVTLIELLAVMAILAVLVAIVAPAVTGTKEAGVDAQILQDATQVRTAATDHFQAREQSEVRTPHTVDTTAEVTTIAGESAEPFTTAVLTNVTQVISTRWPELFITTAASSTFPARYSEVFTTSVSVTNGVVNRVILLGKDGKTIVGREKLEGFTAIDTALLVAEGFLLSEPAGTALNSEGVSGSKFPNFLWLFEKTTSAASSAQLDSREVAVFKLTKIDQVEITEGPVAQATQVDLTYRRVF